MKFTYAGFDKAGQAVAGQVDASSDPEAREQLRRDGIFVTELGQLAGAGAVKNGPGGKRARPGPGQSLRDLVSFARQLQVLVTSGTPMVQALSAIERQARHESWKQIVAAVRERVEEGASLSEAMEAHPSCFDPVCRSLAAAGETSGHMPEMLGRLASLLSRQLQLRKAIVGALIYPMVLVCIGICVLLVMLLFVLPRFVSLFQTLDVPLPPTTRFLIALSDFLQGYWWAIFPGAICLIVVIRLWYRSESGRILFQRAMLSVPKLGWISKGLVTARISRILGVLVDSHVPLLDALKLTRQSAGNCRYADLLSRAEDSVARGEPMSSAFADEELITPALYEAMRSGEQSGKVGPLMLTIADFLDEENEIVVKSLTSLMEPLILVCLGVLVGFIAISMFLPLFDLAAMAQGGG